MTVTMPTRFRIGLLLPALALAACDIPSSAPRWETTWNVPADSTKIGVGQLLPTGVTLAPSGNAFQIAVTPVTVTRRLGDDCSQCALANGTTAPKPAFTVNATDTTSLPAQLASATLVADTLTLQVDNGFDFDPIRPAAGTYGTLTLTVKNGTTTLGSLTVSGSAAALPAGAVTTFRVPLSGAVVGGAGVRVTLTVDSPAGDPVLMNASSTITATASLGTCSVSQAAVTVNSQSITSAAKSIDLTNVSSDVANRVQDGAIDLTITNPFGVAGPVTLRLTPTGGGAVVKSFALGAGPSSTSRVEFTASELRSLLGQTVDMSLTGTVTGQSGTVTITPTQAVSVTTRLQMTLSTGGN